MIKLIYSNYCPYLDLYLSTETTAKRRKVSDVLEKTNLNDAVRLEKRKSGGNYSIFYVCSKKNVLVHRSKLG